jgi:two-component system chemotaxis sensor kinase CheA
MKVSLKFKILLGISFLLVVCTGFNLGYSYKLFIEDKSSYIFETGLKKAANISDQINFKLNDLVVRAEFNSVLLNNSSIDFEKLINNQNEILSAGVVTYNDSAASLEKEYLNTKNMGLLKNTQNITEEDFVAEILSKTKKTDGQLKNRTWVFSPKNNLKFLIYLSKKNTSNNMFFLISDLNPLLETFYKEKVFNNKVISLDNAKDRIANSEWLTNINYKSSKRGAFETIIQGVEVLLSYSFVNDKILVISAINKDDAFGVTKFLILKTSLFATFLLGIGLVAGIYFASSITYPIITLTGKAKKVAEGDFSTDVEINTTDEIKILGDTFNFMSSEIKTLLSNKEELIAKLEDYSKNLEEMVRQRTLELKEANDFMALMVNSLDQGLVVFDSELNCNSMFTHACEPIFGISPLERSIPEVLSITDPNKIQSLKQWAKVIFSEMIPFESAVSLGPKEKVTGTTYTDEDYKFVQLEYYPMRDSEEKISNVVMIATDKTSEVQARETAKEKEAYVYMILKILNNKTQFESFVNEVEEIFEQFNKVYSVENKKIDYNLCMMLFHTLNGGFGIYSMTKIQMLAREYESGISNVKDSNVNPLDYIPVIKKQVENLKQEFLKFRVDFDSLVGTKFATNQSISEIPRSKILELKKYVIHAKNPELRKYFNENFLKVPIIDYFKAYDDLCKTTAVKINKEFNGLTFHNPELKVEAESLLEFFNVLVHLFRNCLDHGLEEVSKRQAIGKTPDGHIDVTFDIIESTGHNLLSVIIQDDGAGIDPKIIRARCAKLIPNEDISHLTDKEIIYVIFAPFFSTRDEVSALSGRGVGMSAIKEVVDRLNGQIEIESQVGKGTMFSFLIPIE